MGYMCLKVVNILLNTALVYIDTSTNLMMKNVCVCERESFEKVF